MIFYLLSQAITKVLFIELALMHGDVGKIYNSIKLKQPAFPSLIQLGG